MLDLETDQQKVEDMLETDIKKKLKVNLESKLGKKDREMIDDIPV